MKLIMDISNQEYCEDGADHSMVELSSEYMEDLKRLAKLCRENALYKVARFEDPLELFKTAWSSGDPKTPKVPYIGRIEAVTLNVTTDSFFWSGYYRYSDYRFETAPIYLHEIEEQLPEYDFRDLQ